MDKYDIAGILQTYAEQIRKARNVRRVKELVMELRHELDLRKIKEID